MPPMPDGVEEGILKGLYRSAEAGGKARPRPFNCWDRARS